MDHPLIESLKLSAEEKNLLEENISEEELDSALNPN